MKIEASESLRAAPWPGWCCSYCSAPLEARAHGLFCAAEGRWFATDRGIHRLLPEDRRHEILPLVELEQRARRDEGRGVGAAHGPRLERALRLVAPGLGGGRWRVLEVGAGCCRASVHLVQRGHQAVAVDVDLDPEDGLPAADRLLADPSCLLRAEAETEALPFEPGTFDLVLASGSIHRNPRLTRALVEVRRVTRRGGALLILDSPVYRRRPDGEAAVAERMEARRRRYGLVVPRESESGYLVRGELPDLFRSAGWTVEVHGWPGSVGEKAADVADVLLGRGRRPRFPILVGRRDG